MTAKPAATSRARRYDPDRKDRIIDAALDVIAEHGVAGISHRRVAAAADVQLGSMTYHFESMADLLEQAFRRHSDNGVQLYARHFENVRTQDELLDAITDLICAHAGTSQRDWVINYELNVAALRDPALRAITDRWMAASRRVLQRHIPAYDARGVDALVEGLIMHSMLATRPIARAHVRDYVARLLDGVPTR